MKKLSVEITDKNGSIKVVSVTLEDKTAEALEKCEKKQNAFTY